MWAISTTNWNFPHFSPCETGERKMLEILIWCRNCSQGSCSYFDFPLESVFFYRKSYSFGRKQSIFSYNFSHTLASRCQKIIRILKFDSSHFAPGNCTDMASKLMCVLGQILATYSCCTPTKNLVWKFYKKLLLQRAPKEI